MAVVVPNCSVGMMPDPVVGQLVSDPVPAALDGDAVRVAGLTTAFDCDWFTTYIWTGTREKDGDAVPPGETVIA